MKTYHYIDRTGYVEYHIPATCLAEVGQWEDKTGISLKDCTFLGVSLPLKTLKTKITQQREKFNLTTK